MNKIIVIIILFIFSNFVFLANADDNLTSEYTKQDALIAINQSEKIIEQLSSQNFSVNYLKDILIDAKKAFEQAKYAQILRGEVNASASEKSEALKALNLLKWRDITYSNVIIYTNKIKETPEKVFLLMDEISVEEKKLTNSEYISEETKNILVEAKEAFANERYNETENLLNEFRNSFEKDSVENSTFSGIKNGTKNFIYRYWLFIIIFLVIVFITSYFIYKKFEKSLLIKKIKKMYVEIEVLKRLIRKTQEERFKENKISGLVYNIRIKKYEEKIHYIEEELPVLESRLKKLKKQDLNNKKN